MDYNATTPIDPEVFDILRKSMKWNFGNAASKTHIYGEEAERAVKLAREQVAELINADPDDIIFTSGATEAINLILKGIFESFFPDRNHIITVQTEHRAVLDTCEYLESRGADVTYLPVDHNGLIDLNNLDNSLTENTILIGIMLGNNETGVLQPIQEAARLANNKGVLFLCDATQAVGKIPIDINKYGIDFMVFSSHKLYGAKGIGALFIKNLEQTELTPLIHGGGHESGLRSGTLNVPGIIGFGKACELCKELLESENERIYGLKDKLEKGFLEIEDSFINCMNANRLPNTTSVCFNEVGADDFILKTKHKIAVSTGSACTSAVIEPSYVLKAMGLTDESAHSTIRFSIGRFTTEKEIEQVIEVVKKEVYNIRNHN